MTRVIEISVQNRVAWQVNSVDYICGNGDFVVCFNFDEEWDAYGAKTARFIHNGEHTDVVFNGTECKVPKVLDAKRMEVGVYAGELYVTTPALVQCRKSILCDNAPPADPEPDVYNQIMEVIYPELLQKAETAAKDAQASEESAANHLKDVSALAQNVATVAEQAETAKNNAKESETNAAASAEEAATSEVNATSAMNSARAYAYKAQLAEGSAVNAKEAAEEAARQAELSRQGAVQAEQNADQSAKAAKESEVAAAASAASIGNAETNAAASAAAAEKARDEATEEAKKAASFSDNANQRAEEALVFSQQSTRFANEAREHRQAAYDSKVEAMQYAEQAETAAKSIDFPKPTKADAGKSLIVDETGTGFTLGEATGGVTIESQLSALIETDMLPAVHDTDGKILTDENGNVILRY